MKQLIPIAIIMLSANICNAQLPAFKGAEGFGALATGGRGKEIYHVTTLDDDGPGSFREGVSKSGRNIVFDIGGVIKLQSRVDVSSNITIAGQTAPGNGITFYGQSIAFNKVKNVIVRYVRMHGSINMGRGTCVLIADSSDNLMFDHISIEWGRWDDLHIKGSINVTLQYSLIGESLDPQRFGSLLERPDYLSIHHCLWIDNQSRNPKAKAKIEYINNVVYNWGTSGLVGGHSSADHYQDIIGNYFISGPSSTENYLSMFTKTDHVYQDANYVDTSRDGTLNGRLITNSDFQIDKLTADIVSKKQHAAKVPVTVQSAQDAYQKVISEAGCSLHRDKMDTRLLNQVQTLGKEGVIIWTETIVGGQEKISSTTSSITDKDKDGIDDEWEAQHSLDANKASDALKIQSNGYTALENYWEDLLIRK